MTLFNYHPSWLPVTHDRGASWLGSWRTAGSHGSAMNLSSLILPLSLEPTQATVNCRTRKKFLPQHVPLLKSSSKRRTLSSCVVRQKGCPPPAGAMRDHGQTEPSGSRRIWGRQSWFSQIESALAMHAVLGSVCPTRMKVMGTGEGASSGNGKCL